MSDGAAPTDDLSALAWVHDELRRSLDAAHKALRRFVRDREAASASDIDAVDPAVLRTARAQLHQGVGALELVGQPEAAMVLAASETLVQRFVAKPHKLTLAAVDDLERASFALLDYLGRRLAGKPTSALALFPRYRAVLEAAGADRVHPADLWNADWRWRSLPADPSADPADPDAASQSTFESLLLALMRAPDPKPAAGRLGELCAGLGAGATDLPTATLWQLAAAMFEAQSQGLLGFDVFSKRVASRLLARFRAFARGDREVPDQLAQDLLFFCAQSALPADPASTPRLAAVRAVYGLAGHAPVDYTQTALGRFDPALIAQAKKRVVAAKDAWAGVAGGELHRLNGLSEQFALVGDSLKRLFPDGDLFAGELQHAVASTQQAQAAPPATLAMEVATSLLYTEAALDDVDFDQPEQARRVARLAERLAAVRAGRPAEPLESWMEELYRRVSDRQTMGSVVQELRASLSEVEQAIDRYFRDPSQREGLIPVPPQLASMRGVMSVLGIDQAAAALVRMRDDVEALAAAAIDPAQAARTGVFERLAGNLGALGFLIDMLSVQPQAAKALFAYDAATGLLRPLTGGGAPTGAGSLAAPPVDPNLIEQAQHLAFSSVRDDVATADVARDLSRLTEEARAADQPELADTAEKAREALEDAGESPADAAAVRGALSEALVDFVASTSTAFGLDLDLPEPGAASGGTAQTAAAVEPELAADDEMREVFLEEAREVLGEAVEAHAALAAEAGSPAALAPPDELGLLTTLRRAYHTLKGSSRMVGLKAFGDAAWTCEQRYNTQLAGQTAPSPELLDFTAWSLEYLGAWVEEIAAGGAVTHDAAVVREAAKLAHGEDEAPAFATAPTPLEATATVASAPPPLAANLPFDLPSAADLDLAAAPVTVDAPSDPFDVDSRLPTFELDLSPLDAPMPPALPVGAGEVSSTGSAPEPFDFAAFVPTEPIEPAEASTSVPFDSRPTEPLPLPETIETDWEDAPRAPLDLDLGLDLDLNLDLDPPATEAPPVPAVVEAFETPFAVLGDDAGRVSPETLPTAALEPDAAASAPAPVVEPFDPSVALPVEAGAPIDVAPVEAGTAADAFDAPFAVLGDDAGRVSPEGSATPALDFEVAPAEGVLPAEAFEAPFAVLGDDAAPAVPAPDTAASEPVVPDHEPVASEGEPVALDVAPVAPHAEPEAEPIPVAEAFEAPYAVLGDDAGRPSSEAEPPSSDEALAASPEPTPAPDAPSVVATDAEPPADAAAPAAATSPAAPEEDQVKVVGPLRIGGALFNIYLGEADELSRRLAADLAEWSRELHRPIGETPVALAHSLAGNSATVGYAELSQLARALEQAMTRSNAFGFGTTNEATLFVDAADEIRALLHQFAAGFLRSPSAELLARLAEHERIATAQLDAAASAPSEAWAPEAMYDAPFATPEAPEAVDTSGEAVAPVAPVAIFASPAPVADDGDGDAPPLQTAETAEMAEMTETVETGPTIEPVGSGGAAEDAVEAIDAAETVDAPQTVDAPETVDVAGTAETADTLAPTDDTPMPLAAEQPVEGDAAEPPPLAAETAAETGAETGAPAAAPNYDPLGVVALKPLADLPTEPTIPRSSTEAPFDADEPVDVDDAVDADLFPIFADEAEELIPQLAVRLREWARRPGDAGLPAACMRTLHTLKGGARLAGAMRLGELAHRLETRIERLSQAEKVAPRDVETLLVHSDRLAQTFEALRGAAGAAGAAPVAALPAPAPAAAASAAEAAVAESSLPARLPPVDAAPTPTPLDAGPDVAAAPPPAAAEPAPEAVASSSAEPPGIDWSRFARSEPAAPARTVDRAPSLQSAVRVRAPLLDRLVNQAGEVSIARSRIESGVRQIKTSLDDLTENLERLRAQLRDIEFHGETQMSSRLEAAKAASQAFDPLEFDRFTRFQELTRMMAESVNDVGTVQRSLQRSLEVAEDELVAQARMTRELQDDLLRTRMVEFEGLSDRLYRVVRQTAKESGKSVRLDIVGGGVEVDRGVLDRMTGSFEHLLRNAVVHGIEPAEVRAAAGKPPTGAIVVALAHDGNEVSVEVRDDGAGLDLPRIRAKGVALGMLDPDAPSSDDELAGLIFEPGFTTSDAVTELAGRGVGMDVVRSDVNAMGGRIETATSRGQGSSFKLVLPLTTAVTQVVMLRCGDTTVALPSTLVEAVRRATPAEVEAAYASGSYAVGDRALPFFWLGALLQTSARSVETDERTRSVVVVRSAQQRIAVHVDDVLGNREVVVKNLGPQLARLPGLTGVSLLASGEVALIYNPVALAALYGDAARESTGAARRSPSSADANRPAPGVEPPAGATRAEGGGPLVMVVDDSLTVRRVTQRLLVREGYRVLLAKDGLDALEQLAQARPEVLLSDIEMPRMDGFDLVRNVRAQARLRDLPVIMITSRIAQKHRDYASELGVDHYLGKPYSEEDLLALIARYTSARVTAH